MKPIKIRTKGNSWELNGHKQGLLLRWAPAVAWLLLKGKKEEVDRLFRRTKSGFIDGLSIPLETRGDGELYKTGSSLWDYGALRNGNRPRRLQLPMQRLLFNLITKLQEHHLVANLIWDHTLWKDNIPAGAIGHCFRQLARWFQAVERGSWNPNDEGVPDNDLAAEYIHLMGKPTNVFVSLHHEAKLQNGLVFKGKIPEWTDDNGNEVKGDNVQAQFNRLRKLENGHPSQWPGVIAGTSLESRTNIKLNNMDFMSVDLCPLEPLESFPTLCYYENVAGIDKATMKFYNQALNNGVALVVDDDVFRADDPQSKLEELLRGDIVVDPNPEPDPEPPKDKLDWEKVMKMLKEILDWLKSRA